MFQCVCLYVRIWMLVDDDFLLYLLLVLFVLINLINFSSPPLTRLRHFTLFFSCIVNLQQAMEERYKLCDDGMARLLVWISNVEAQLANQDTVREDVAELKNQINVIRVI